MSDPVSDQGPAARVTIVCVCYNSDDVLPAMLGSLPDAAAVVLVDNAATGGGTLRALADGRGATLIQNDENKGFGVACNQGAALARTEFILFLNPDARLTPGSLEALVAAADRHPDASAFNPRIATPEGRAVFQRSSHLIDRAERMPRGWPDGDCQVPILSGAALFVRRAAFEAVGGFDPRIFLYHEDDDLSRRLKDRCGPLYFIRDACAEHIGGSSSARSPQIAALKAWHMGRSRVYVQRKHGRPFPRALSLGSAVIQLCSPAVLFSRRKRAKQVAFFKGVVSASLTDKI